MNKNKIHEFEHIVAMPLLLQKAKKTLKKQILINPTNTQLLFQLGENYRKLGDLQKASETFYQLNALDKNNLTAKFLAELLDIEQSPECPNYSGCSPSPFVLIPNFLSDTLHQSLIEYCQNEGLETKQPSKINNGEYNADQRLSYDIKPPPWLTSYFKKQILAILPNIVAQLGIPMFTPTRIDTVFRAYGDNQYFRIHTDQDKVSRLISSAYYFYSEPKLFTGGELLLFDTDRKQYTFSESYTRITPTQNTMVFFPSACFHAVQNVRLNKNDLKSGRFAINSHLWLENNQ